MKQRRLAAILKPFYKQGCFYNYPGEPWANIGERMFRLISDGLINRIRYVTHNSVGWRAPIKPPQRSRQLLITWIGHSTFLIQVGGYNILTDPIFGSPTFLFPRLAAPGISFDQLPPIDMVIISHNHYDHMHGPSLKLIEKKHSPIFLVPQGDKQWFDRRGFKKCREFMWWDEHRVCDATYTFLPAHHWSQRGLFDRNRSLWGSWMLEIAGVTIYFAGDTAYGNHFIDIRNAFKPIDVALMPIGPCEPHDHMKECHVDAHQACEAFLDLQAKRFIPMHWGTFFFGTDSYDLPIQRLHGWWQGKKQQLTDTHLHVLKIGQNFSLE
ncbi:MAG: MBL fold metallo-hydrolase [Candidatus Babeliales bacterium]